MGNPDKAFLEAYKILCAEYGTMLVFRVYPECAFIETDEYDEEYIDYFIEETL